MLLALWAALLLPSRVVAGVAVPGPGAVASCPEVIKNAVTAGVLLSDGFVPDDVFVPARLSIIDTVDSVGEAAGELRAMSGRVDTINTVDTVDTIKTVEANDTVGAKYTVNINAGDIVRKWNKRLKFGRRVAFNNSRVSNMSVRVFSHDGDGFSYSEYRNQANFGIGFEAAGIIALALSDAVVLKFSPGVVFRKPVNTAVVGTSEVGLSFPVLLWWGPFAGVLGAEDADNTVGAVFGGGLFGGLRRLRLFGGVWAGVPLYAWMNWNWEGSAPFGERSAADIGFAVGAGVYLSDRAFIDVMGIFGLSGYDGVGGHRLNQLVIGVNYVK